MRRLAFSAILSLAALSCSSPTETSGDVPGDGGQSASGSGGSAHGGTGTPSGGSGGASGRGGAGGHVTSTGGVAGHPSGGASGKSGGGASGSETGGHAGQAGGHAGDGGHAGHAGNGGGHSGASGSQGGAPATMGGGGSNGGADTGAGGETSAIGAGGDAGATTGGIGGSAGGDTGAGGGDGGTSAMGGNGGTTSAGGSSSASDLPSCAEPTFVDTIADGAWVNLDVTPKNGTSGIRDAIHQARDSHPDEPVRIRLAKGTYPDTLGAEMYVQRILRPSTAPIWIIATDSSPNATVLGHGINFVGVSYFAFEGLTIGPASVGKWNGSSHASPQPLAAQAGIHIAGAAKNGGKSAVLPGGSLDASVYGQYEPSHHILIRSVTIQNVFSPDAETAEKDEGQSMDGVKFNQAEDVWVIGSTVTNTSRHGIDNVGVHRGAYCGNVIAHNGGGLGIEAKGGSFEILYESNVFDDVRRVELGGENTDATYYFSVDGLYTYEAKRVVARNNLIVDGREAGLEFSGCDDCSAVGNTVLFSSSYVVPGLASGNVTGGDAVRAHDSLVLGAADGAGSDCISWDDAIQDYTYFDNCWGVGSHAPAPINHVLATSNVRLENGAFISANGTWRAMSGQSTIPCPLSVSGGTKLGAITLDGNYWWNGGHVIAGNDDGCAELAEGPHSTYSTTVAASDPKMTGLTVDMTSVSTLRATAPAAMTPLGASPLLGAALTPAPDGASYDFFGKPRATSWTIGAIEGN